MTHRHLPKLPAESGALPPRSARARKRIVLLLILILVPAATGLIAGVTILWPDSRRGDVSFAQYTGQVKGTTFQTARTTTVVPFDCQSVGSGPGTKVRCAHVKADVMSGPDRGVTVRFDVDPTVLRAGLSPGDNVQVVRFPGAADPASSYAYVDFTRSMPMWWLALAFAAVVIGIARFRGVAALAGLSLSFWLLLYFMIPALLSGENPLAVAFVGSAAIMFVLLYLAHGVSIRTTTALIGTMFGLGMSAALGVWVVSATHLTGIASEDDLTLTAVAGQVRLSGLLLAGVVVASLGILNDVTVTQASAVWELRALDPAASSRRLYTGAMRIGRDHIASSVYTIVFAYAGSALPVLLLINLSDRPIGAVLTSEALAEEIVRTLIGGIGLVLAVPVTTAVAVVLLRLSGAGAASGTVPVEPDRPWTPAVDPAIGGEP